MDATDVTDECHLAAGGGQDMGEVASEWLRPPERVDPGAQKDPCINIKAHKRALYHPKVTSCNTIAAPQSFDEVVRAQGSRHSGSSVPSPPPVIGPGQVIYSKGATAQPERATWDASNPAPRQTGDEVELRSTGTM
jgi:hypothetical protein